MITKLKAALEAIERCTKYAQADCDAMVDLRTVIAQLEQAEPVAYRKRGSDGNWHLFYQNEGWTESPDAFEPLYAAPVQPSEWEKLRDPAVLHANLLRGQPAQLTTEQLLHLLGDKAPVQPKAIGLPACPDCHAPDVYYECVFCGDNNYPPKEVQPVREALTEGDIARAIAAWFSPSYEYNSSMETRMRAAIEAAHNITKD